MRHSPFSFALVFLGGALGTVSRYALSLAVPQLAMLFVVNLFGAAFLGFVNASPTFGSGSKRAFWGVGFAGGFTTMSGVALWVIASSADAFLAPLTASAMFVAGVGAYLLGLRLGKPRGQQSATRAEVEGGQIQDAQHEAGEVGQ